ncbi:PHP domain-containing protein [Candidatus Peregrinibacteria bacterium]|nr:PHP domain-containing protein [Candidatus Peregrinibacteria bacterium]
MEPLKTMDCKKPLLKCQFHTHAKGDGLEQIKHSPKELIDHAAKLKYDVLSITSHRKVIFNKELKKYAKKKGILLISGIEFEINKKHILGINMDKEIEKIKTFDELRIYKKHHPECLIIAPHPFFPGSCTLKKDLINNIEVFDAIENSFCYTKFKNYNKKAISLAKRWRKPIIATSDCHILEYLDLGYTLVKSKKEKDGIIEAIKKNKIKTVSAAINPFKLGKIYVRMTMIKTI